MEPCPACKPLVAVLIVLLCGAPGSSLAQGVQTGELDAEFQGVQRLCEEFFLPNSMARPPGFDLQGHMHEIEVRLRDRAARFRSPEGIAYLRSHRERDSDDISRACAGKLLALADPIIPRLAQCLAELRASKEESAVSGCALAEASDLVGSSRDAIRQGLGEPQWCRDGGPAINLRDCGGKSTWGYSFYRVPGPGGGPELLLQFADDRVENAEWFYTQ